MQPDIRLGTDFDEGRFHRQSLIEWWDQERLSNAKVLVIGAGALGNEILKNLALVGVGHVLVADMDQIEHSNLARSVLFRQDDIGRNKAEVAAARVRELYPDMEAVAFVGNVVHDLGAGAFHWADITICGLDNREARVAANTRCLQMGRPWVDGAIERLDGVARVFLPDRGACYECTMSETDWQMLEARRSCALLSRQEMAAGRTPTTATTSSIVAGFQCQEALKYLHGFDIAGGAGVTINGQTGEVYGVTYPRNPDCFAHETIEDLVELPVASSALTMAGLLERGRRDLGDGATIELSREILHELECPACHTREELFVSLGKVTEDDARCEGCGEIRIPKLLHAVDGTEAFLDRTPTDMGLPPFDLILAHNGTRTRGYLVAGDADAVLGPLAATYPILQEALA